MLRRAFLRADWQTTQSHGECRLRLETLEDRTVPTVDMVIEWNNVALQAIKTTSAAPPVASRALAIVHAAIYDAVNAIDRNYTPYLVNAISLPKTSPEAAVAAAANTTLSALFPTLTSTFNAKLVESLSTIADGAPESDGVTLGQSVANQILALRANDNSTNTLPPFLGGTNPGEWRPTPRTNVNPELPGLPGLLPNWPTVTPFALTSGAQFRPGASPGLTTQTYTDAFNEVKALGSATGSTRTADQTNIALFWSDGAGTVTPPGHMNQLAQIAAQAKGNSLVQNARLFAMLNFAEADAAISCWDAKYAYTFWRPITGIREAAADGNPATTEDLAWKPLINTPNFPSYTSGHSTFSGAAAKVLANFFSSDNLNFTLTTEAAGIPARTFNSFSQAAQEAAVSRLYGGIHWRFDNEIGLTTGNSIGDFIFRNFLKPIAQSAAVGLVGSTLAVSGGAGNDNITVTISSGLFRVTANGRLLGTFPVGSIGTLAIDGRNGNDYIQIDASVTIAASIYGGAGNDILLGGSGNDSLFGEDGRDFLYGNNGNDRLNGGAGLDYLFGGNGDDVLFIDLIYFDVLSGGAGNNQYV